MRFWGGRQPPAWLHEIANDRPRPLVVVHDEPGLAPTRGDIVLKPVLDSRGDTHCFRLETWNTHDLLDGPFDNAHDALESAFELGATSHLTVWLDYSNDPHAHDLDNVPLYRSDPTALPWQMRESTSGNL
jgi:hypothetical protein